MVMVTLVYHGNLVIKLILQIYMYLRFRLQDGSLCKSACDWNS